MELANISYQQLFRLNPLQVVAVGTQGQAEGTRTVMFQIVFVHKSFELRPVKVFLQRTVTRICTCSLHLNGKLINFTIQFFLYDCECYYFFLCRHKTGKPLPPTVDAIKTRANAVFEKQKYNQAILLYNQALAVAPDAPVLYGNRAAAFMKRSW